MGHWKDRKRGGGPGPHNPSPLELNTLMPRRLLARPGLKSNPPSPPLPSAPLQPPPCLPITAQTHSLRDDTFLHSGGKPPYLSSASLLPPHSVERQSLLWADSPHICRGRLPSSHSSSSPLYLNNSWHVLSLTFSPLPSPAASTLSLSCLRKCL